MRLKDNRPEPENLLDQAVLALGDILEHQEINALMIIDGEEALFYSMHSSISHDDDAKEVPVEPGEKFKVCEEEENGEERNEHAAGQIVLDRKWEKYENGESRNEHIPCNKFRERPQEPDPVLMIVEMELFIGMFALKINIRRRAGIVDHHRKR